MLQKAFVEEVVDKNTLRIRIPRYDLSSTSTVGTKFEDLMTAPICAQPGINPSFAVGDVVIVDFENDMISKPIVIGELFCKKNQESPSTANIKANSLEVALDCNLPANTTIGNVQPQDLCSLSGTSGNIQSQLNILQEKTNTTYSNRNLLLNPFFSINTFGNTSWSAVYTDGTNITTDCVDKWLLRWGTASLNNNELTISTDLTSGQATNAAGYISQRWLTSDSFVQSLLGKTCTLSVNIKYLDLPYGYVRLCVWNTTGAKNNNNMLFYLNINEVGIHSLTFTLPNSLENNYLAFGVAIVGDGVSTHYTKGTYVIDAFKLELGDKSTLEYDFIPNENNELQKIYGLYGQTNPNILDNGWFTINQRGKTTYNTSGVGMDRWRLGGNTTVVINNDVLTLTASGTYAMIYQTFESGTMIAGETYTLSVLFSDNIVESRTFVLDSSVTYVWLQAWEHGSSKFQGVASYSEQRIYLFDNATRTDGTVSFKACKLERGGISTLAYDNPPKYGEELAKCQRFLFIGQTSANAYYPCTQYTGNIIDFMVPIPVSMRATPVLSWGGTVGVWGNTTGPGTASQQSGFTFSIPSANAPLNAIAVRGTKTNHGLAWAFLVGQYITLSAEL